ncbi:hypothetical protein CLF_105154 [Clonorchis sinensis]|uniref:Endonuclease/exonuclease/phosphatase domain-containing protein n=1 Tax=Clonorchis sinensis TaxID=79923 RepID=G7YD30_CLOSI|nr:hypothetical protein CLF_105154 [Clonorchis sinensis]
MEQCFVTDVESFQKTTNASLRTPMPPNNALMMSARLRSACPARRTTQQPRVQGKKNRLQSSRREIPGRFTNGDSPSEFAVADELLPGVDAYDRKNSRGGVCDIYSKTELRAPPFVDSSLEGIPETTWIFTKQNKRSRLIGCTYLPPAPSPDFIADLSRIISSAHALPHSFKFLLSDFNLPDVSWSPTIGPIRYAALLAELSVEGWSQLLRRPTRGLHTLDLIFSNDGHLATAAVGPCFPGSDHCVVSCNAVSYGQTVPLSPSLFHLLSPDILQAFSSALASYD